MGRHASETFTPHKSFKADEPTWTLIARIMELKAWTISDVCREAIHHLAVELGITADELQPVDI